MKYIRKKDKQKSKVIKYRKIDYTIRDIVILVKNINELTI